jgi:hypothetical protein
VRFERDVRKGMGLPYLYYNGSHFVFTMNALHEEELDESEASGWSLLLMQDNLKLQLTVSAQGHSSTAEIDNSAKVLIPYRDGFSEIGLTPPSIECISA